MKKLPVLLFLLASQAYGGISFVGKAEGGATTGTVATATVPAHAVDDLIIAMTASDGGGDTHSVSGGGYTWSDRGVTDEGTVTTSFSWAIASGTSSFVATFTNGSSEGLAIQVLILRGLDVPISFYGGLSQATGSTITPIGTGRADVTACSWNVVWAANDRDRLIVDTGWPTNTTGIYAKTYGTNGGVGLSSAYDITGDSASEVYTWSDLTNADGWAVMTASFKPATIDCLSRSRFHTIGK